MEDGPDVSPAAAAAQLRMRQVHFVISAGVLGGWILLSPQGHPAGVPYDVVLIVLVLAMIVMVVRVLMAFSAWRVATRDPRRPDGSQEGR